MIRLTVGGPIKRFEPVEASLKAGRIRALEIRAALEIAGIEFIGSPEDGPGIRTRIRSPD